MCWDHLYQSCYCLVAKLCLTLWPNRLQPSSLSVHGISRARILEWVAISISMGSSWSRDWTCISWVTCVGRWILYQWATSEALTVGQKHLTQNIFYNRLLNISCNWLNPLPRVEKTEWLYGYRMVLSTLFFFFFNFFY